MFTPSFSITNAMLSGIVKLEVNSKIVQLVKLQTDWESRLITDGLIKRIVSMARQTDNELKIDDIAKIIRDDPGRDEKAGDVAMRVGVVGKEKEIQQILNLLNTSRLTQQLIYLSGKFKQGTFGESELVQINGLLGERLISTQSLGKYRDTGTTEMFSYSPLPVELAFQMEDLFNWFKSADTREIHPLIKTGVMLYELIRICPFLDNNLLSSFHFFYLTLSSEGYGFKKLLIPEEELLKNREKFRVVADSVEKNLGDLTEWLEFLCKCVGESAEKTTTKVMNLVGEAPIFKSEGGRVISLTERQIAIMEEMTVRGEMAIKDIRSILPVVSDDTILRDLKDLIEKKMIRKKGRTKGAVYVMGKSRSFK